MAYAPVPPISKQLLDNLKERFPNRLPEPTATLDDIRLLQGEQRVIAFLANEHRKQSETLLEK